MLAEVKHLISIRSRLHAMMLDKLHMAGIEIVSPSFMNTRAVPAGKLFIPQRTEPAKVKESEPVIEKLVFDIADEAESIEKLNEMLGDTLKEMDALKDRLKEAASDEEKEKIRSQLERLDARSEQITRLIQKMNEQKED